MKCEICNKEFRQIRTHIEKVHNMDPFDYYAKFISNTFSRNTTPYDFAKKIINLSISNSNCLTPLNKELYKAFVSSI